MIKWFVEKIYHYSTALTSWSWTWLYGKRKVVTPRGMLEKWALKQSYFKKKIFFFFIEKYHLKNAACLRATSKMEAKTLKKLGFANKIIDVPNSIKIPKLKSNFKKVKKKKRLLFLSRLHPKKGLVELLGAWQSIHNKYLDLID